MTTKRYHRHATKAVYESVANTPTVYRDADNNDIGFEQWRSDFYFKNYRPDLQRQLDNCATVFDELSQVLNVAEYVDAQKISAHLAFIENELVATVARAVEMAGLREA
jgi:hypothetical protein